jgi:hypothetical protein
VLDHAVPPNGSTQLTTLVVGHRARVVSLIARRQLR